MSRNGIACSVDIYEEGYTGISVTTLTGSAEPFIYEEDDSNDLLDFVRVKTARLRVVEETYGTLEALHPTSPLHHYVVAKYGSEIVFTGYMECAEYSGEYVACPREIEFPVISPLGILGGMNFPTMTPEGDILAPTCTTVGTLMQEVMNAINPYVEGDDSQPGYQWVMYPGSNGNSGVANPWNNKIRSVAVCPFNSSFKHYSDISELYAPKSYQQFVEGLCTCLGWTVHDTPQGLIFVKYDDMGGMSKMAVSALNTASSATHVTQWTDQGFTTFFANRDSNATHTVKRPLRAITFDVDGTEPGTQSITMEYMQKEYNQSLLTFGMQGKCRGYIFNHTDPTINSFNWGGTGSLANPGLYALAWFKYDDPTEETSFSFTEGLVYKLHHVTSIVTEDMFRKSFYMDPRSDSNKVLLQMNVKMWKYDTSTHNIIEMPDTLYHNLSLLLTIKRGNQYYDIVNTRWGASAVQNGITIAQNTCKPIRDENINIPDYSNVDGIIFDVWPSGPPLDIIIEPLELIFSIRRTVGDDDNIIIFFQNITLSDPDSAFTNYHKDYLYQDKYKITGEQRGTEEASLTATINNLTWSKNENTFLHRTQSVEEPPSFPHMFYPQRFLDQRVERIADYDHADMNDYNVRFLYGEMGGKGRCRILSKSFFMRVDELRLIFAQSQVLNS